MLLLKLAVLLLIPVANLAADSTCFGASFRTIGTLFEYKVHFKQTDCNLSRTNVTRLYMLGACTKQHINDFGNELPPCPPGDRNVMGATATACQDAFQHALPHDIRHPHGTKPFDSGHICNDGYEGIIFVQTDCEALTASTIELVQRQGGSDFCWDGHTMSRSTLVGIIFGGVVGVCLLIGLPMVICSWHWRQQRKNLARQSQSERKPALGGSTNIVKISDSVYVSQPVETNKVALDDVFLDHPYSYDVEYGAEETELDSPKAIPLHHVDRAPP